MPGISTYAYAYNNAVNFIDLMGLMPGYMPGMGMTEAMAVQQNTSAGVDNAIATGLAGGPGVDAWRQQRQQNNSLLGQVSNFANSLPQGTQTTLTPSSNGNGTLYYQIQVGRAYHSLTSDSFAGGIILLDQGELSYGAHNGGPWIGPKYDPLQPIIGGFGAVSRFVGSVGLALDGTSLGVGNWVKNRPNRLLHGKAQLHPRYMDLFDDAYVYANRFLSGRSTLNLAKFAKVAGPVATLAGMGVSAYNLSTGNGTAWDVADLVVNTTGLLATGAATFLVLNPVGLTVVGVIGTGVLIYNGARLVQGLMEE